MATLHITADQLIYLKDAIRRDLGNLEEMAPWEIDDHIGEHAKDIQICLSVIVALDALEVT